MQSKLSFLVLNVCGLVSKIDIPEFQELCRSRDILCFSETKCDDIDIINVEKVFGELGFKLIAENRHMQKRKSGGILLCIKENIYRN